MPKPIRKPVSSHPEGYPSLNEHEPSRRRFLQVGLAVAGAGALTAGCPGFFGQVSGDIAEPNWHRIRFPADPDDRAVYLSDNGYARFYAVGLTYDEDVAMFAEDTRDALTTRLASEVSQCSYDELSTEVGISNLCERMRQSLNEAYNDNTGDVGDDWFQQVELYLVRLDAPAEIGGVAPEPSYP